MQALHMPAPFCQKQGGSRSVTAAGDCPVQFLYFLALCCIWVVSMTRIMSFQAKIENELASAL